MNREAERMANSYEKVLSVISKKPSQRQDFEIQSLLPWLRKKANLFRALKTGTFCFCLYFHYLVFSFTCIVVNTKSDSNVMFCIQLLNQTLTCSHHLS